MKKILAIGFFFLAGCGGIPGEYVISCVNFCKNHNHGSVLYMNRTEFTCTCTDETIHDYTTFKDEKKE
jgi:hypothetical protein